MDTETAKLRIVGRFPFLMEFCIERLVMPAVHNLMEFLRTEITGFPCHLETIIG